MILIALGSNIASDFETSPQILDGACRALEACGVQFKAVSRMWESTAVGANGALLESDPLFYNAVASIETDLEPHALLELLHQVEEEFGRDRAAEQASNLPRTLDLDLLLYNDTKIDDNALIIPHPRMKERGFVLLPLGNIDPEWRCNDTEAPLKTLIDAIPADQQAVLSDHHFTFMRESLHGC